MLAPAGQVPDEPRVDRPEREAAGESFLARALDVVENPADLARGKVGVDEQAGLALYQRPCAIGLEPFAEFSGAAILPHDGVVHRPAGRAIPHHRCLALVRDAHCRDVTGTESRAAERLDGHADLGGPDLAWIVFDPPGAREDLRELLLRHSLDAAVAGKDNRT